MLEVEELEKFVVVVEMRDIFENSVVLGNIIFFVKLNSKLDKEKLKNIINIYN